MLMVLAGVGLERLPCCWFVALDKESGREYTIMVERGC